MSKSSILSWLLDLFLAIILVIMTICSSYYPGWQYTIAVSIFGLALLVFLRVGPLTQFQLKARKILNNAERSVTRHHVLGEYCQAEIEGFVKAMQNLEHGKYETIIEEIPQTSINCINNLKESGFVVYVTDSKSDYYRTVKGQQYLEACYKAGHNQHIEFTRLFVINNFQSVTQELLDLMEKHKNNNIKVLVAERNELLDIPSDITLDFGLFDNKLLMKFSKEEKRSARLEVHFDDAEVVRYRGLKDRLINLRSYKNFIHDLYEPINGSKWARILAKSLYLEVPYGLSKKDAEIVVQEAIGTKNTNSCKILILGLTPVLIEAFNAVGAEVWCVDQANIAPRGINSTHHIVANWLDFRLDNIFDAIVSDEALNNLSLLQYRPFFQNLSSHVKDGGRLVMRVMCRVPGWEKLAKINSSRALKLIQERGIILNSAATAATMLRILHSKEFGFDEDIALMHPEVWNQKIAEWKASGEISVEVSEKWTFPYVLTLSSPTLDILSEIPRGLFVVRDVTDVDPSYCPLEGELEPFYRMVECGMCQ